MSVSIDLFLVLVCVIVLFLYSKPMTSSSVSISTPNLFAIFSLKITLTNIFLYSNITQSNTEYKKIIREVTLPELITVSDLAERMAEKVGDVVKKLFSMGTVATSNQVIDADTAEIIITEFGHNVKRVQLSDVENILDESDDHFEKLSRAPIVTIMGHINGQ